MTLKTVHAFGEKIKPKMALLTCTGKKKRRILLVAKLCKSFPQCYLAKIGIRIGFHACMESVDHFVKLKCCGFTTHVCFCFPTKKNDNNFGIALAAQIVFRFMCVVPLRILQCFKLYRLEKKHTQLYIL